jgi:hypothetical protein
LQYNKQENKTGRKNKNAEMKFLRRVASCKRKGQIRNSKIMEELNILNQSNKVLESRSEWKHHVLRMEDTRIPKQIFNMQPQKDDET